VVRRLAIQRPKGHASSSTFAMSLAWERTRLRQLKRVQRHLDIREHLASDSEGPYTTSDFRVPGKEGSAGKGDRDPLKFSPN
jgi:hypothetical protein